MRERAFVRAVLLLAAATWSSGVRADEAQEKALCIDASDKGQQLRDDGKYRAALEAFARCARESCPVLVRQDCVHWLLDLDQSSATVVIDAKDDKGNDLVDVTVTVDGEVLATKLDGKPLMVDPGQHLFRYEATGFSPVEEHVVVHTAEKNRQLLVRLGGAAVQAPNPLVASPEAPSPPVKDASEPGQRHPHPIPAAAWIFSGVAVASFASEAYFGISGLNERSHDLEAHPTGCAPTCPPDEKSTIQTKFAIADVSLGVGLVSSAIAAYFFLLHPSSTDVSPAGGTAVVDVAPTRGGAVVGVTERF